MYGPERQQAILTTARSQGRVEVAALATSLGVTPETIRRDLSALERQGLLRRVHGGAIPVERLDFEPGLAQRDVTAAAEKERIAKAALDLVPERGSVLLDAGTTTARLARLLGDRELDVVTNAVPLATLLATAPGITIHLLGGRVRGTTLATVDEWALRALADVHVDVSFLGANGFSLESGLTTPDRAEAAVKRAMLRAGRQRVALVDAGKYGADQFARFAGLDEIDVLVTDTRLPAVDAATLEAAGPEVVLA